MKIEFFTRLGLRGRRHYFRVLAANGEPIAQSEGYARKIDAVGTANLLKNGVTDAELVGLRDGDLL